MDITINLEYGVFKIVSGPHDTPVGRKDGYRTMKAAKQALTLLRKHRVCCHTCGALTGITHEQAWDPFCNIECYCFCSDECEADYNAQREEERAYLSWATSMGYEPY
jgi:hypothetical protein